MKKIVPTFQNILIFAMFASIYALTGCTTKIPVARQHFVDQSTSRLPQENKNITKSLFGDLDRDGDLDLILLTDSNVTNEQIIFLENNGRGQFKDNTSSRIPELYKKFREIRLIDINGDEILDIFLLGDVPNKNLSSNVSQQILAEGKRDYLLISKDTYSEFIDETSVRLPEIGNGYEEIKSADVDNDGDIDLLITGSAVPSLLLINRGAGIFRDETLARLPTLDKGIQEAVFGDVDGDRDIDIFFAMENRINILLINNGDGLFTDETEVMLPKVLDNARDAAIGDIDGDGDIDIVIVVDELTTERAETTGPIDIEKYEPFPNANFEQGIISTGWPGAASAWRTWSMSENIEIDQSKPMPEEGTFYATSFNPGNAGAGKTGGAAVGTIKSQDFTIPFNAKTLSFLKTGWDGQFGDREKNFFYLRRVSAPTIEPFKKTKPPLSDSWELHVWDVTDMAGETVYFEAVDENPDSVYASIGFDSLKLSNSATEDERWEKREDYILVNDGKGMFHDETLTLSNVKATYRVDLFDADHDKDLDIFVFGVYGASLLINDGYGNFRDETYARLPNADTDFGEVDFGDIDNDGDIDIVAVHVGLARLLINELNPEIIQENIHKLKDLIVSLPDKYFKEGKLDLFISAIGQKGGLIELADQAEITKLAKVRKRFYEVSIEKLQNEFLKRSDGCSASGKPDDNDWVVDCSAQLQINSLVLDTIEVLASVKASPANAYNAQDRMIE